MYNDFEIALICPVKVHVYTGDKGGNVGRKFYSEGNLQNYIRHFD